MTGNEALRQGPRKRFFSNANSDSKNYVLRDVRARANLTLQELSGIVKVSMTTLGRYEHGKEQPSY